MFYVGIDQHKRHLTICVRNEQGDVALRRQVKTGWLEVDRFLESLQERSVPEGGYVAIMEVCGFNDWLLKRLARWGCTKVYVIAAPPRLRNKTDRRDSAKLSELLWINRERIAAGRSPRRRKALPRLLRASAKSGRTRTAFSYAARASSFLPAPVNAYASRNQTLAFSGQSARAAL